MLSYSTLKDDIVTNFRTQQIVYPMTMDECLWWSGARRIYGKRCVCISVVPFVLMTDVKMLLLCWLGFACSIALMTD
uniref:Uncharacterized protein n=1 Tax=Glossina brevipalpis TaxID=37001 RepID=A0A1A9WL09_9MUSC